MQIKHFNEFRNEKMESQLSAAGFALTFGGSISVFIFAMVFGGKVEPVVLLLCALILVCVSYSGILFLRKRNKLYDVGLSAYRDQYLAALSKEQLIAVSVSREFTAEERSMATAMLNNRHPGWSLNISDPSLAGE